MTRSILISDHYRLSVEPDGTLIAQHRVPGRPRGVAEVPQNYKTTRIDQMFNRPIPPRTTTVRFTTPNNLPTKES